ncbi:unnamed protein product [Paramecium sonneborni]|uniref:Uncharacterized protein n=1 Tax=Paramecium sonneborni TaxID=65129 RepID=A0A8S1QQI8_9CILI|nr:unnamed protein product [Paramecium sonneborni]
MHKYQNGMKIIINLNNILTKLNKQNADEVNISDQNEGQQKNVNQLPYEKFNGPHYWLA